MRAKSSSFFSAVLFLVVILLQLWSISSFKVPQHLPECLSYFRNAVADFFSLFPQQGWNAINLWPLKNNAGLCRDGPIPVHPTSVSFRLGLLINLFIRDRRVSTQHTLCVLFWLLDIRYCFLSPRVPPSLCEVHIFVFVCVLTCREKKCVCSYMSAKSVNYWQSLITCPGNFKARWACGAHQGSTVGSRGKHVSHMWFCGKNGKKNHTTDVFPWHRRQSWWCNRSASL